MRCFSLPSLVLAAVLLCVPRAGAQDATPSEELKELRQAVEKQSKQIQMLTEQVLRLTHAIEAQKGGEVGVANTVTDSAKPTPPATPAPDSETTTTPEAPKAEGAPKAEAVVNGSRHVVAKGETLTSIAKQYNIPIADLKKVNKIQDERKLQIGQVLTVPTATAKAPDSTDKKENP